MRSRSALILSLRTGFVLAILALMPMMALPPVTSRIRKIQHRLFAAGGTAWRSGTINPAPAVDRAAPFRAEPGDTPAGTSTAIRSATARGRTETTGPVDMRNVAKQPIERSDPVVADNSTDATSPDRMHMILQRLRQLGATYTSLETHPDDTALYRFRCEVPIRDTVYSRTFEHSGPAPEAAMNQVLQRVESWYQPRYGPVDSSPRTARRDSGGLP